MTAAQVKASRRKARQDKRYKYRAKDAAVRSAKAAAQLAAARERQQRTKSK